MRQDYDRFGHLSRWRWGSGLEEAYEYDKSGRLSAVSRSNVTLFRLVYLMLLHSEMTILK